MTFNTAWGRFRYVCFPWVLACAQDIFQWMMDQILTCCNGVIGITDVVVVHGKDDKEHDKHLHKFMRIGHEHGLVFNKDKSAVKQTSVVFLGCVYDATGVHFYPEKVSAVHKMLSPETATQLQKFLGLITYLSPFIPSLSSFTAPLYGLLKKGTEFFWNNSYQEAFNKVESLICKNTTLWYFDIHKCVTVQVDASQKGLGAALLQDGCPVAFASKALTPVEQCFANIECELLACVFGAETIPYQYLWLCLHYWEWPQASWTDQHQESGNYTSSSTENVALTPKLWYHHQVLKWQRDVGCRCPLSLCTPQSSKETFRHHHQPCAHHTWQENWVPDSHARWPAPLLPCLDDHCRFARWYQWCPMCSTPIPWPQKHPHS